MSCNQYHQQNIISHVIENTINKPCKQYEGLNDILLKNITYHFLAYSYKLKILQMRVGLLWEKILCLFGFQKISGADVVNHDRQIVMELKNAFNTDNASSRKENIRKLIQCKIDNNWNDYMLVYGIINDGSYNNMGKCEVQYFNGIPILFMSGNYLFHFVFGNDYQNLLNYIIYVFNFHVHKFLNS